MTVLEGSGGPGGANIYEPDVCVWLTISNMPRKCDQVNCVTFAVATTAGGVSGTGMKMPQIIAVRFRFLNPASLY